MTEISYKHYCTESAQAMGIKVELVTADEAYHDGDDSVYKETDPIQHPEARPLMISSMR